MLTSEGEFWRGQRKLAQPAFHRERIAAYARLMVDFTERMLDSWDDGQVRDVQADMMRLTLEIVAKTLFDAEIGGETAEVSAAMETLMQAFIARTGKPDHAAALDSHAAESPGRAGDAPARTHPRDIIAERRQAARTGATCSRCSCTPRTRRAAGR